MKKMIKKFGERANVKTHKVCDSMSPKVRWIVIIAVCSIFAISALSVLIDKSDNTQLTEIQTLLKSYGGE